MHDNMPLTRCACAARPATAVSRPIMFQPSTQTILLIENQAAPKHAFEGYLRGEGYDVIAENTGNEALSCLRQFRPSALILDLPLPDIDGLDLLRQSRAAYPQVPVIVVTDDASPQTAVDAMSNGAADFILKPVSSERLAVTLRNALERDALEREIVEWRQTLGQSPLPGFIGHSPAMLAVYRVIDSVAASKASVFITGESGTGKQLAALALHQTSPRREKPFVAIDCGGIPSDLLESTLFGHVKGAFTGAVSDHDGAAKKADGGTLFLNEVCELPLGLQIKLLRFLQTGEFTPIGGSSSEVVDVRIIAATVRNPRTEVSPRF